MPSSLFTPHHTIAERREVGRAARKRAPRSGQGQWDPGPSRPDALATIEAQNPMRVPSLVPIRRGRMAASPWTYLRGAAAVMASDLALSPHSGLTVQLCGDAHVLNFGLWATPERNLSFDLRDFDETLPGPFEWDVKRLAASLVVLARDQGRDETAAEVAVAAALAEYRTKMADYATARETDIWYDRVDVDALLARFPDIDHEQVERRIRKRGQRRTSLGAFTKRTQVVDGQRRLIEDPPLLVRNDDPAVDDLVRTVMESYHRTLPDERKHLLDHFRFLDVGRTVVGVGSVGMRVFLLLLSGRDELDPLFLQIKQAGPSVLEAHVRRSRYRNHGARVVNGQRLIQSASDIFLGWTRIPSQGEGRFESDPGGDYYVRQFRDYKVIPEGAVIAPVLEQFAAACGGVLARAHARSGDPVAISAYLGSGPRFDDAVVRFARAYADQTERDHAQLVAAITAGEVEAAPGW